jgi:ABC-2 type transport system permease protein
MVHLKALFKREFLGYFRSPVAYVFTVIFLLSSVGSTFFIGRLYESNQASLAPFFTFLPWLFLVLIPAIGMRLWAEERHSGTIELLFTLPVSMEEAVIAKFLAGWAFVCIAITLTFPLVLTVAYLGSPDWGVLFASYFGSYMLAGCFLAITCVASAFTKNQVIAFILGVITCFFMVLVGWGVFTDILSSFLPVSFVDTIAKIGVMPHFETTMKGMIDSRDLLYFVFLMAISLKLNAIILNAKKAS